VFGEAAASEGERSYMTRAEAETRINFFSLKIGRARQQGNEVSGGEKENLEKRHTPRSTERRNPPKGNVEERGKRKGGARL